MLFFSCFGDRVQEQTKTDTKFINFDLIESLNDDLSNSIKLIIEIPLKKLVFKKMIDHFYSDITIDILITDNNNKIIISDSWSEKIIKNYYEETKSSERTKIKYDFILDYGDYTLNAIINDFENHINWAKDLNLNVKQKIGLGLIEAYYKYEDELRVIDYDSSNKIDTLWINYKVYNSEVADLSFDIEYLNIEFSDDFILNSIDSLQFDINLLNDENKYEKNIKSEKLVDKDQYVITEFEINKDQYIPIIISDSIFNIIKINLLYKDEIKTLLLNFINYNNYEYDLTVLIGPMYYLLNADYYAFENLLEKEQIIYIKEYWEKSSDKQLLKEFYKRVLYANKQYNYLLREGWETDRGRIYIINGAPEKISYEYNDQTEFEIWEYNNRHYIFINNYGDYELYDPNNN